MFVPKLITTLQSYTRLQFGRDVMAGLVVGVVALPLAFAFAIASGISPERGLLTAIIAGFIVSAFGGSRVQIGGPTGAFIVVVDGIIQAHGIEGLIIATFLAGIILILIGLIRLGSVIRFIPVPLITGFTTGIALIIFTTQIKDFLGLHIDNIPGSFTGKVTAIAGHIQHTNLYAVVVGVATVLIILKLTKFTKIPGSLAAVIILTIIVQALHLPVDTIGSRFGSISSRFPAPRLPYLDFTVFKNILQPAFTIALLCAIESLLSAAVADNMIRSRHKPNIELVAQGTANICSALFGGLPATGAIARTATNVKNGGRTPVAGMVHSVTLLVMMLFLSQWVSLIPLPVLSGILFVVAYHMSEWRSFWVTVKGNKNDRLLLMVTFILTILTDLTVAIEIGIILSFFLFIRNIISHSNVVVVQKEENELTNISAYPELPQGVEVIEISGPLFFGTAHKILDAINPVVPARILIVRMQQVLMIDATGIKALQQIHATMKQKGAKLILSDITSKQILDELKTSRLLFAIGKANITNSFSQALERCRQILN